TVVFNDGAVGKVTAATATSLTILFTTKPKTAGKLTAVVTSNGGSSGAPVSVATLRPGVTANTDTRLTSATLIIHGFGFDPNALNNKVNFNVGVGTVKAATPTSLIVTFAARPTGKGNLTAVVTTNGANSGVPVQVATLTPSI